jgi:hypothetical protein
VGARAESGGAIQCERCGTAARVSTARRRGRRRERELGEVGGLGWGRCVCFWRLFFRCSFGWACDCGCRGEPREVDDEAEPAKG